ncbi:MAG TPA: hypothetical protein VFH76_01265, partial [Kribbella sp.]|nr:hypothetical protein [Kribbella sp.]
AAGYAGVGLSDTLIWPALVLSGTGMGLAASPLVTQSLVHVPLARAADASGMVTTTMQLSQVAGVTIFGTLFLSSNQSLATTAWFIAAVAATGIIAGSFLSRAVRAA